jgi:lipoprotein-releasing system permease protein
VATLIVVNSVLGGFSRNLRLRLQGAWSDVVIEAPSLEGFSNAQERLARIRQDPFLNARLKGLATVLECPAVLQFRPLQEIEVDGRKTLRWGRWMTCPVKLAGIAPATCNQPGAFSLALADDAAATGTCPNGIILSTALVGKRDEQGANQALFLTPGIPIQVVTVRGERLQPVQECFVVADCFHPETSCHDSSFAFVSLDRLRQLIGAPDRVTSINLKLWNYQRDWKGVKDALARLFPSDAPRIKTWEERQATLLQAVALEEAVLQVLLFLINCVAGFCILAIFSMVVTEKRRDIGILKALGASDRGVLAIFLGHGLLLGLVGACFGTLLGGLLTREINQVERFLSGLLGGQNVEPKVYLWTYYFNEIPTCLHVPSILMINAVAVAVAVLSSALPAWRAAKVDPAGALRSE